MLCWRRMIKETKPSKQGLKNGDVCHLEMDELKTKSKTFFLSSLGDEMLVRTQDLRLNFICPYGKYMTQSL